MNEFEPGDRVMDVCWDGCSRGRVSRVDGGRVFVRWDGRPAEDEMSPNQIVQLEETVAL